jgi:Uma2 family endonuclease
LVLGKGINREVVQPDIMFVSHERKEIVAKEEIRGAPDLIVEVVSSSTEKRDRGYKKVMYARHGVREYWIADPEQQFIEVYAPQTQGFQLAGSYRPPSSLMSKLLPALEVELEQVFRDQ